MKLTVHPAADIFPMMSEEELADLAEDIKANGLIHPIIVDKDNQLIDGRNRYAACKLAGVEPRFEQLNGRDPALYIAGANLNRRNLTKGQQAMGWAMLFPEPEKGGRGKKTNSFAAKTFSDARLSFARTVLAYSTPMAKAVLKGELTLDDALEKVKEEQTKANTVEVRMDRLRKGAPDLAELVAEERMPLNEAYAAYMKRDEERRNRYQAGVHSADWLRNEFVAHVSAIIGGEESRIESEPPIVVKPKELQMVRDTVTLLEEFCRRAK